MDGSAPRASQAPASVARFIADTLSRVLEVERATAADLAAVDAELARHPEDAALWELKGDLLQLTDEEDEEAPPLEAAGECYRRAAELAPSSFSPVEALGHFHDAVLDDPAGAAALFRQAIAMGAGESAREGLAEALAQLEEQAAEPPAQRRRR